MESTKMEVQYQNGSGKKIEEEKVEKNSSFRRVFKNFQINEWTFSLFLFALSLGIVVEKIVYIYGDALPSTVGDLNIGKMPSLPMLNAFNTENLTKNQILNATQAYRDSLFNNVIDFTGKFGWLMKAAFSGFAFVGITWFIVYKDSNIPGVNPPSPFSPSKTNSRFFESSRLQINYLVGVINGVLIFIYMCLCEQMRKSSVANSSS